MDPERIGGYEILGELGRGAMGVVYRGRDAAIGRPVAIKVIRVDAGTTMRQGAELRQRLIREASVAGNISHPGIVTVYQLGEDGDAVFIAMEFVEGSSLESLLANDPPHDRAWVLDILAQISVALDYAHRSNVVHRDIKPANILVRSDGRVKIADFGIAKLTAGATSGMTGTGMSVGSPAYMSPEQVQANTIDGRSDQFALATMAFQMLAGRMPFKGNTAVTLMFQIVTADPFAPQSGDIPLAENVRAVLARALSKNPNDRFPTCAAFIQELTHAVEGQPAAFVPPKPAEFAHAAKPAEVQDTRPISHAPAPAPFVSAPPQQPPASKSWMLLPIIGGLVTVGLIGGGIYWWYSQQQATQTASATPSSQPNSSPPNSTPPNSTPPNATPPTPLPSSPGNPSTPANKEAPREKAENGAKASSGTSLLSAVASGNVDAVKALLAKGANVNEADHEGTTALMVAAEGNAHAPIVAELLGAGAQVDSVDAQGRSALYRASAAGRAESMRMLLDHGATANLRAKNLSTPLLEAVSHGRLEAAQVLIEHAADVNMGDSTNTTPLMAAADTSAEIQNPGDFIRLLLKHGAKRGLRDSQGRIAFQRAVASNNAAAVALLR